MVAAMQSIVISFGHRSHPSAPRVYERFASPSDPRVRHKLSIFAAKRGGPSWGGATRAAWSAGATAPSADTRSTVTPRTAFQSRGSAGLVLFDEHQIGSAGVNVFAGAAPGTSGCVHRDRSAPG